LKPPITEEGWKSFWNRLDAEGKSAKSEYERIRSRLVFYFESRCRSDAEDLADETIACAIESCGADGPEAPMMNFCYGIARNVLLARGRRERREVPILGDIFPGRDSEAENSYRALLVDQLLRRLTPAERASLKAFYLRDEDSTPAENGNTRRSRARRAILRLRAVLGAPRIAQVPGTGKE